jgi:hypothetical protein
MKNPLRSALSVLSLFWLGAMAGPAVAEENLQVSGPPLQIAAATSPAVASDAAGNFVVVRLGRFQSAPLTGNTASILLQRYDAEGRPAGPEIEVASHVLPVLRPRIAVGPGGGMVLAWSDQFARIWIRRLAADGQPAGDPIDISAEVENGNYLPDIAFLRSGDFVVTWQNYTVPFFEPIFFDNPILARLFAPNGDPRGPAFEVSETRINPVFSRVAADPVGGGFAVAWENDSSPLLKVRRFAGDGSPLGPEQTVVAEKGYSPVPIYSAAGELSVA